MENKISIILKEDLNFYRQNQKIEAFVGSVWFQLSSSILLAFSSLA
jgi:hypothetical protein